MKGTALFGKAAFLLRRAAAEAESRSLPERLAFWFQDAGIPRQLVVFLVSMLPLIELRGGLPVASLLNVPYWQAILLCMAGNFLPIPFILLLIVPLFRWMRGTKLFRPLVEKLEAKAMGKKDKIEKYAFWGLVLFVGIPIPGTGGWMGALIAALLGLDWKKSSLAALLGILLAGAIMSLISYVIMPLFY